MKSSLKYLPISIVCFLLMSLPIYACTIFTLTNSNQVLFCNNEDWEESNIRIWFIPAVQSSSIGKKLYGRAYVGFSNQWGQGGINTEGLSYDWVAGFNNKWEYDPKFKKVRGNPAERMLESSATVEEAIVFFKNNWEPSFSYAKILIADRSGTSAIIGAKDGVLYIKISKESQGFGYGIKKIQGLLGDSQEPTLINATQMLKNATQEGRYATKYSNVFDLKTGNIFIFRFPDYSNPVKLNLVEELNKGDHYYDITAIEEQINQELKSLSRFKEWIKNFY